MHPLAGAGAASIRSAHLMALGGNSTSIESLSPRMRAAAKLLLQAAPALGATAVRVTSTKRSRAQQTALYKNFVAGKAAYPVAPPGTSKHERGLAIDVVVSPPSMQSVVGRWWQSVGGVWGGQFNDPIHFEL